MKKSNYPGTLAKFIVGVVLGIKFSSLAFAADWTTYGYDIAQSGFNSAETSITADNVSKLSLLWSFNAKAGLLTQPLLVRQVSNVNGKTRDLVFIGDLDGNLFAIDAKDGSQQWSWSTQPGYITRHCSSDPNDNDLPNGHYGIIATPVIDRGADGGIGRIYLGLLGKVFGLALNTGAPAPGWSADGITIVANPFRPNVAGPDGLGDDFGNSDETGIIVYSALTLNAGKLYVEFGGISCDLPTNYRGRVVAIDAAAAQLIRQWFAVEPNSNETGGSIWGVSGAAIDPTSGIFVATGNTIGTGPENNQFGEHVVKLSLDVSAVLASDDPTATGRVRGGDHDFGSNPILFQPKNCQNPLAAVLNKNGELLVYARDHLGDNANFPPQVVQIGQSPGPTEYAGALIGAAAWNDSLQQLFVSNNSDGSTSGGNAGGVLAFSFADCQIQPKPAWVTTPDNWAVTGGAEGAITPPSTAHDVVYFGTGASAGNQPKAYALDARPLCGSKVTSACTQKPGQILWQSDAFTVGVFVAPSVVNGVVYVPSMDGVLRAYSLGFPALAEYSQVTEALIAEIKGSKIPGLRATLLQKLRTADKQFLLAEKKGTQNKTRAANAAFKKATRAFLRFQTIVESKRGQRKIPEEIRTRLLAQSSEMATKLKNDPTPF